MQSIMPILNFKAYFILAEQDSMIRTDNPSQLLHSLSSLSFFFFFSLLKSDAGQHPVLAKSRAEPWEGGGCCWKLRSSPEVPSPALPSLLEAPADGDVESCFPCKSLFFSPGAQRQRGFRATSQRRLC